MLLTLSECGYLIRLESRSIVEKPSKLFNGASTNPTYTGTVGFITGTIARSVVTALGRGFELLLAQNDNESLKSTVKSRVSTSTDTSEADLREANRYNAEAP